MGGRGVAVKAIGPAAGLQGAQEWFFQGESRGQLTDLISARAIGRAENALQGSAGADAYCELLPYILDPHGPGSRRSVRRDPRTRTARARKRGRGVFYTPPRRRPVHGARLPAFDTPQRRTDCFRPGLWNRGVPESSAGRAPGAQSLPQCSFPGLTTPVWGLILKSSDRIFQFQRVT